MVPAQLPEAGIDEWKIRQPAVETLSDVILQIQGNFQRRINSGHF
jgi:hypothetical protein